MIGINRPIQLYTNNSEFSEDPNHKNNLDFSAAPECGGAIAELNVGNETFNPAAHPGHIVIKV